MASIQVVAKCIRLCVVLLDMHLGGYVHSVCECNAMCALAVCAVPPGKWACRIVFTLEYCLQDQLVCAVAEALTCSPAGTCSNQLIATCLDMILDCLIDWISDIHCTCWSITYSGTSSSSKADLLSVCEPEQIHCWLHRRAYALWCLYISSKVTSPCMYAWFLMFA